MARSRNKSPEDSLGEVTQPFLPRDTIQLQGHEAAVAAFCRGYRDGALHHAWLLTGERGVGKATFAYAAARFLLSAQDRKSGELGFGVDAGHSVAQQISAGAHPSLFVLEKSVGAASIGVEGVRKLRPFLGLTSPGAWRIAIVDAAGDLTAASANALLKGIEEPPAHTVFFIVSHGLASVLPTIRSRCIRLPFRTLSGEKVRASIVSAFQRAALRLPDDAILEKAIERSRGSPGRAMTLLSDDTLVIHEALDLFFSNTRKEGPATAHRLLKTIEKSADAFASLCDGVEERVEERARCDGREWAELWAQFREKRLELEALNLDKGAFLISAFSDIERVAQRLSRTSPS